MTDPALRRREEMLALLAGKGIEIGAMHQPVPAPHLEVRYVDRVGEETLRRHYSELGDMPFAPIDIHDDGQVLESLADASQDFVIANHVIEHMQDPIRALQNWSRVLRSGGHLFMAVPDKEQTFDKTRQLTTIEHLVQDYENPSDERDYEAFLEFALEVSAKASGACTIEGHREHADLMWREKYSIHYHVWDQNTFRQFLDFVPTFVPGYALRVVDYAPTMGDEFVYVMKKR